jgi:hypothetical protein
MLETTSPGSRSSVDDVLAGYDTRRRQYEIAADAADVRRSWAGRIRLLLFVGVVAIESLLWNRVELSARVAIAALGLTIFTTAVVRQRRAAFAARLARGRALACSAGIARVNRDWGSIPPTPPIEISETHAFADDLGISGRVSIMQLLGPLSGLGGRDTAVEWLLQETPATESVIAERQGVVKELTPQCEWREVLGVLAGFSARTTGSPRQFLSWARSAPVSISRGIALVAPPLTALAIALLILAIVRPESWRLLAASVMVNIVLTGVYRRRLSHELNEMTRHSLRLVEASTVFAHVGSLRAESGELRRLVARIEPQHAGALRSLAQIATCADARLSPLGYVVLQSVLLWDFHVVGALQRWRRKHGDAMPARFEALAELEALSSFATLAYENPDWAFPEVQSARREVRATRLAHPLLPRDSRVPNDIVVGPAGTFVLVTGSNMSGKSTLLRAIGLNAVLAQIGAPVCAESLAMPRVRIRTIMHVRDSIGEGTSLFMAELLRIRDAVRAAQLPIEPMVLYLADEMLHGTNVDDQRVATIAVVKALSQLGAIGLLATHLDGLVDDPSVSAMAHPIHFTEAYESSNDGLRMNFDYRIRPGLATSRNALALVRMIALGGISGDGLAGAN